MAHPAIGTESFLSMRGAIQGPSERLRPLDRSNADFQAYAKDGIKGPPFQLFTVVDVHSAGAARNKLLDYWDMKATIVDIVDRAGASWDDFIVLDVVHTGTVQAQTIVGGVNVTNGASGWLLGAAWVLQATEPQTAGGET